MIVYVSIGNSDDNLPQRDWAEFVTRVDECLRHYTGNQIHHVGFSKPDSQWQNACWCVEFTEGNWGWSLDKRLTAVRSRLVHLAGMFGQESIAWAEVKDIEFLGPNTVVA